MPFNCSDKERRETGLQDFFLWVWFQDFRITIIGFLELRADGFRGLPSFDCPCSFTYWWFEYLHWWVSFKLCAIVWRFLMLWWVVLWRLVTKSMQIWCLIFLRQGFWLCYHLDFRPHYLCCTLCFCWMIRRTNFNCWYLEGFRNTVTCQFYIFYSCIYHFCCDYVSLYLVWSNLLSFSIFEVLALHSSQVLKFLSSWT